MLKRSFIPYAVVAMLGAGAWLPAGLSGQESGAPRQSQATAPVSSNPMVHLEGCVFVPEALDSPTPVSIVTGRSYTYLLTHGKVISGPLTDEVVGRTTYLLDKVAQDELRGYYGKRVGVTGRVGSEPVRPKLEVVSIREVSGGCPVLPRLS